MFDSKNNIPMTSEMSSKREMIEAAAGLRPIITADAQKRRYNRNCNADRGSFTI